MEGNSRKLNCCFINRTNYLLILTLPLSKVTRLDRCNIYRNTQNFPIHSLHLYILNAPRLNKYNVKDSHIAVFLIFDLEQYLIQNFQVCL
jgi:hypothetical protein